MPEQLDQLRAAIATRLQCVRGDLSEPDFAMLVDDVAHTARRLADIEARGLGKPATPVAVPIHKEPDARAR